MEIISGESNPLVELKVSTAKRLSGKLDASPERVLREIPIRIMQEVNTNKEQNNISPESRMLKENERCLFQHNIKPIFRRTRKSDVQHQLAERLEPKTRKLSTGRFSLGLSLGSNAKVSTTARLEESVALKALLDVKGKNIMKNVKRRNKLLATGNSVENDKNLLGAPAVSAVESTCIKPHCDGMSEMNISAMTETRAENVAPSRCNTLLEAEKEDQMSRSEMYNSPKPFSFNATVEELGITPSVFTSTSAEKGKSPASLHKLRRRSTIGLRGSPETNCLIRYIAQQRSLALGSPLSPDFMYRSRDNSALKEKIRAFRRSFQSVDENDRPAPSHDHIEGREPDKGFKEMPTSELRSSSEKQLEPPLKKKKISQEEDSRSDKIAISLPRSVTYWNGGQTPIRSSLLSTTSQYSSVKKTPLFVKACIQEDICPSLECGKENFQPQTPLQKLNDRSILKSDSKMNCEERPEKATSSCTINSEQRRVKKVTFAGELKPELFDEKLPPNTPLCKGGTPARLQVHNSGSLRPALKKTPLQASPSQKEASPSEFCKTRPAFIKERREIIPFPDLSEEAETEHLDDKKSGQSTDNQKAMESCQLLESTMGKNLFTTDLVPELFDKMLPSKTLLRKGGTLVFVPVSSSPCKILEKTPINDAFPQPSFDISEECLEPTAKEMVNIIASDLVETPSSAPQSSDSVRGPTADYPSLPDFKSPNMAESSDDFLGTKCFSSQKPHFDVRETPAVETAGASDGTEISKVENVSDSTAVSQEDQPRLRLRRKCAEQSSNGNSSTSKKPKSDTTARKAPKTIKKTSAAVTRKSQASKRNGKHTRKGKKSGTRKQIYGAREFASKKPILSPIVEIPETLSPASNCDTPRDQKAASKGKVVVTPYYGKHPSNVHSKRVCNMASGASSCVMKADIKICLGQSQKFIVKNDIDISQNDQESLQDHTLKILNCPETDSEASDKHEVLQITEDVMRNEHPSSDMTSCHENKKRSSRRSLAASSERGEMVLVKEPLGAVVDLERVKPIECDGGSNSVTSENDTAKIHTEVVGKSDYEQQISADKCGNAIIVCSSGTTKNVVKMKKRRNLKPSEMVFVAEITHESSETGISLEANVSHAVKSFVSEDVEDIAVNVEGAQTLTSFFSPKMEIKKGKRRSALTRLSLGQEESNEMNSSLQDCHMTALEVESIYDSKVNCRKPSGRRRSSIYCPSENKNAHSVTIVSNNCESSGDICMSSTHRRDDQPYADSITYTDGDLQMSQPSGSASEKRKVRRSMRLRRESDIIGLDWIQSSPSKTDDSESLLDMTSGKSRRRTLHVSSLQNSDCMTQSRRNRRASLVLQKTSCESKAIREESMLNMFAL